MKTLLLFMAAAIASAQQTGRTVVLTWQHPDPSVGFRVYRGAGMCSSNPSFVHLTQSSGPITQKTYSDVNPGYGNFCYQVTAFANGKESAPSQPATASVEPQPPTGLTVTVQVSVSVTIPVTDQAK